MSFPSAWGAPEWWPIAVVVVGVTAGLLAWSYRRSRIHPGWAGLLILMKLSAVGLLAICLLEPLANENRPQTGANLVIVAADVSQSMNVRDQAGATSRAERLKQLVQNQNQWLDNLEQDFDLRMYEFAQRPASVRDFSDYAATGEGTSLNAMLQVLAERYRNRPLAGAVLLTDGTPTDELDEQLDWASLPPIYPVVIGQSRGGRDLRIVNTSATQSNFESAPVAITVEIETTGMAGQTVEVQLLDDRQVEVDRRIVNRVQDDQPFAVRFQVQPERRGVVGYTVRAFVRGNEELNEGSELTVVNNTRQLVVNRDRGPYRILYVSGRPNWEFRFLNRALTDDDEINLVGLIRVAKAEPKFTFRAQQLESTNPLFRGLGLDDEEEAEQYDEPVLIRVGVRDRLELLNGFPRSIDELYEYDGLILDDIEAEFFTADQQSLINQFVSTRGGGLLMLGGVDTFQHGNYDRTPIGEMLPVYLDAVRIPTSRQYQLDLTRDGWLQPWVRLRSTEDDEAERLAGMPQFRVLNPTRAIKPGASVLARVNTPDGEQFPALVVQRFGRGSTGALLVGDMWRWQLATEAENDDLLKAWRQMMRWLVSDVPQAVDVEIEQVESHQPAEIKVIARDDRFQPLDNANVQLTIQLPDGEPVHIPAQPAGQVSGEYRASFMPRQTGLYQVRADVTTEDGTPVGNRDAGFVWQPLVEEFARIRPDLELMRQIAERTGGELIEPNQLSSFVRSLPYRDIPYVETRVVPWWHHWRLFVVAIALLAAEWGIRRWKGLA